MSTASNPDATAAGLPFPLEIPSLDNNYGAMMLGTFGGLMIYGITVHQGYRYMHLPRYKTEQTYIKAMVAFVLLMETLHSVLMMHVSYYSFATKYCRPDILFQGVGPWSINLLPMVTGIVIVVSQSFFAYRLFKFNPRYLMITVFVFFLIVGELALSVALTVESFIEPGLSHFQKFNLRMESAALGMAITADVTLTVLLITVLHRSRTGFKSTDSMINVLIVYTINTGLLTGTISTISFIMNLLYPDTLISDALTTVAAKLYANSMLAVLNSRQSLSKHDKDDLDVANSYDTSAIRSFVLPSHSSATRSGHDHVIHIKVAREGGGAGSLGEDVVFTDHKPEQGSIDPHHSRRNSKDGGASQNSVSHEAQSEPLPFPAIGGQFAQLESFASH